MLECLKLLPGAAFGRLPAYDVNSPCNGSDRQPSYLVTGAERLLGRSFVHFAPDMMARIRSHELDTDAYTLRHRSDVTLDQILNLEFFLRLGGCALVWNCRVVRYDF